MRVNSLVVIFLGLCSLQHVTEALIPLVAGALALTSAQLTGLATIAIILGLNVAVRGGLALSSTGRKRRAAREAATDQIVKGNITVDTLAALEPEDCFQRLFCSAATRRLENELLEKSLNLVDQAIQVDPENQNTLKYKSAAGFGETRKNVDECEEKFYCSVSVEILQLLFQE
ncbi:uncharacterized protein LOC111697679 [Eurytemora carolleeae]|uniref:uncharacterized protein LOC111697679 n=1 Tax=Eurytemora carolleeae TaxID=1294199 RepID=UPI000C772162|nr:uncharacterized protein LOC111697679 [Eurytemora carolleeae]|eukprot:XP_023323530.1 uncharacterized protein LOC111697679 [Eurytemora affinis]